MKRARLLFPASHPAFAGHFPGMPVVPGALLLAAALEALGEAARGVEIVQAKFLRPVGPDCPVEASCEPTATGALRLELRADGQLVASALLGHAGA